MHNKINNSYENMILESNWAFANAQKNSQVLQQFCADYGKKIYMLFPLDLKEDIFSCIKGK
jgi:hypothetical protein